MKSQHSIRAALGMTQAAIADLLNVSRVQWALYECGQRSLPRHAVKLLTALTLDVNSQNRAAARDDYHKEQVRMQHKRLERLLIETEYKHAVLLKNIEVLARRREEAENLFYTIELVNRYRTNKAVAPEWPLVTPKLPSSKSRFEIESKLLDYEIEIDSLECKKLLIQSKLRKISKTLGFTGDDAK